ncbi:MAG: hypothetical protein ACTHN5_08955 [Phycisphaerae bacterium]
MTLPSDLLDGVDAVERARLEAAEKALQGATSAVRVPEAFNDALRARLLAGGEQEERGPVRRRAFPGRFLAVAASLVIGVFLGAQFLSNRPISGASVAWGDVVHAVNAADHFHLLCYSDAPRGTDAGERASRIDLYYQAPNLWRSQGLKAVAFNTPAGTATIFPEGTGSMETKVERLRLIPQDLVERTKERGLLEGVLWMIFRGRPPAGEPVKSDVVAASQGIEVFDYANRPTAEWARIWVLKDSRLPLRIHLYYPESDAFMSVEFDYSDAQPAEFFDVNYFRKELAKRHISTAREAYMVGMHPLAGAAPKPRNSAQINEAVGGYRAPEVRRVLTRENGDVALVTTVPENRLRSGARIYEQGFDAVVDSWGNRYIPVGHVEEGGAGEEACWYFTPRGPGKTGSGPRRLSFSYSVTDYDQGQPGPTEKTISTGNVGMPAAEAGAPEWARDAGYLERAKPAAIRNFLRRTGTLEEQLAAIDAALAKDPQDMGAVVWKVDLMRAHGREAAAWELFGTFLNRHFPTALTALQEDNLYSHIGQYLVYLAHEKRWAEFDGLAARLEPLRLAALAATDRESRNAAEVVFGTRYSSLLAQAMAFREWQKLLAEHPPAVTNVFLTKDGAVCVQLRVPLPPEGWQEWGHSAGDHWNISLGWFWDPQPTGNAWQVIGHLADMKTGEVWLALRPAGGERPERVTLAAEAKLLRDNMSDFYLRYPENTVTYPWSATVPVPAATVADLPAWWKEHTAGRTSVWYGERAAGVQKPPELPAVDKWAAQAEKARDAGRFEEAAGLYRKIVAAPAEQYPAWTRDPAMGPDMVGEERRGYRVQLVKMLVAARRLDAARTEIAAFRATIAGAPDSASVADSEARESVRAAGLALVRGLLAEHQLAEARAEMEVMAKERPDVGALQERALVVERGMARQASSVWQLQQQAWMEFDTVWWELRDAEEASAK